MRAYVVESFGKAGRVKTDVPMQQPQAHELLIEVHASGVNPVDTKIAGGLFETAAPALPAVIGMDVAGVVVGIGEAVNGYAMGDEVYGCVGGLKGRPGTLADYVVADARLVAPKPASLSMREAAALPLVCITAWEGLIDRAKIRQGDKVLIHSGAGGVGHVAVQIAKAHGADVYTTVSTPEKQRIAQAFGVTAIPYRDVSVADYVAQFTGGKGFDVVYDTVGGQVFEESAAATKLDGKLITCAGWGMHNLTDVLGRSLDLIGIFMALTLLSGKRLERHGEILQDMKPFIEAGQLRPLLDPRRFTLDEVAQAHEHLLSGQAIGKIVVDIKNPTD